MKSFWLALVIILGHGCAAKKLAVKNADTLLEHQLEKRLPLESKQEKQLSSDIDSFLNQAKPKAQELIPLFDSFSLESNEQLKNQFETLRSFFKGISIDFSQIMSKHMATLNSEQQKDFFNNLKKENKDLKSKSKKERKKDFDEKFEFLFGSINPEQENLYKDNLNYFELRYKERIKRRENLQAEFKAIYQSEKDPIVLRKKFNEAFIAYQERPFANEKSVELTQKLAPTLTKEQKDHFKNNLIEFKDLIRYFIKTNY